MEYPGCMNPVMWTTVRRQHHSALYNQYRCTCSSTKSILTLSNLHRTIYRTIYGVFMDLRLKYMNVYDLIVLAIYTNNRASKIV